MTIPRRASPKRGMAIRHSVSPEHDGLLRIIRQDKSEPNGRLADQNRQMQELTERLLLRSLPDNPNLSEIFAKLCLEEGMDKHVQLLLQHGLSEERKQPEARKAFLNQEISSILEGLPRKLSTEVLSLVNRIEATGDRGPPPLGLASQMIRRKGYPEQALAMLRLYYFTLTMGRYASAGDIFGQIKTLEEQLPTNQVGK